MRKRLLLSATAIAVLVLVGEPAGATIRDDLAIIAPAPITAQATTPCGSTWCALLSYSYTVTGGTPPYNLVCNLPSPRLFLVGITTVSCFAQDAHGNSTPPATVQITVTPPDGGGGSSDGGSAELAIVAPGPMTAQATTPCGSTWCALLSYSYTVTGGTPPYNLVCNLPSPRLFLVGITTVSCFAQDAHGNSTPPATVQITVTPPDQPGSEGSSGGSSSSGSSSGSTGDAGGSGSSSDPGEAGEAGTVAASGGTNGSTASGAGDSGGTGSGSEQSSGPATTSGSSTAPGAAAAPSTAPAPASSKQAAIAVVTTAVRQATMTAPRLRALPKGARAVVFAVRVPGAATIRGTVRRAGGRVLLRFRAREAKGHDVVTKRLPASGLRKGTWLTLRVAVTVEKRTRTFTRRFRA